MHATAWLAARMSCADKTLNRACFIRRGNCYDPACLLYSFPIINSMSGYYNGVNYRRTMPTISCNNYRRTLPMISWNPPINNYTRLPRLSLERPVILKRSQSPESTSSRERSISLKPSQAQNHPEKSRSRSLTRLEHIQVGS